MNQTSLNLKFWFYKGLTAGLIRKGLLLQLRISLSASAVQSDFRESSATPAAGSYVAVKDD